MRRIVVLGCGFGGLNAAQTIEPAISGRRHVELTVVNPTSHFLYTPLLSKVAAGQLKPPAVSVPLRRMLSETTDLVIDRIESIDLQARRLHGRREAVDFDYLLLAPGASVDWSTADDPGRWATPFKTAADAMAAFESMARAFETADASAEPDQLRRHLSFTVVGAGPTGVELAAHLATAAERHFFPHVPPELRRAFQVNLVERHDTILPDLPPELQLAASRRLRERGVIIQTGRAATEVDEQILRLSGDRTLPGEHVFWCGGMRPPAWLADTDLPTNADGRVEVDETLHVLDQHGIYAIGDAAACRPVAPRKATVAADQGRRAAKNLVADLSGQATRRWTHDPGGWLLSLGTATLAYRGGVLVEGWPARAYYRVFHTTMMPGALQKASLAAQWLGDSLAAAPTGRPGDDPTLTTEADRPFHLEPESDSD